MQNYRQRTQEIDLSGYAVASNNQIGAMVVRSQKGNKKPILNFNGEQDILLRYGKPNSDYFTVFEAIEYSNVAPLWVCSALGSNYRYAGVDVRTNKVYSFGKRAGRVFESYTDDTYSNVQINNNYVACTGSNGTQKTFSGTVTNAPLDISTIQIIVGGKLLETQIDLSGIISGDSISSGVIDETTGDYSIEFSGQVGQVTHYESVNSINVVDGINLQIGLVDKLINLSIDGVLYQNINFGQATGTQITDIVNIINTKVGYDCASIYNTNYIQLVGKSANANYGNIQILPPSSGQSAVSLIFDSSNNSISVSNAISPTNYVPKLGDKVEINYNTYQNVKAETAFSLFTSSPFEDDLEQWAVRVTKDKGYTYRYTCILYQNTSFGYVQKTSYNFSLIKEKNAFGKSIYYEDVFKNNDYLKIYVNTSYQNIADPISEMVILTGGDRGDDPTLADYQDCWDYFKQKNIYKVKTFMDVAGNAVNIMVDLVKNYQYPNSFAISPIPPGNNALAAISYRNALNIDCDGLALYTNWMLINDPYSNSFAWISGMGKIGVKYAQMDDVFDGLAPAGIDENGHGGQLKGGFQIVQVEYDYSESELQLLDEAQINPIVFKNGTGVMAYGNRTTQVVNSDTSFIPHRRLFNYIIDNVNSQILTKQQFKLNDDLHRLLAKSQTETFLSPILALNLLRSLSVICDESNNDDDILQQRLFIVDILVRVTPFSEFTLLRLTRLPQGGAISSITQ